jgi:hypothetical protein
MPSRQILFNLIWAWYAYTAGISLINTILVRRILMFGGQPR